MKTMISLAAAALLATVSIASAQNTKPSDSTAAGADSTARTTAPAGLNTPVPQGGPKSAMPATRPDERTPAGAGSNVRAAGQSDSLQGAQGSDPAKGPATTGMNAPMTSGNAATKPSERTPAGADSIARETNQSKAGGASK